MRVLLVGEGKNDLGYRALDGWCDGVLTTFVKRLLQETQVDEVVTRPWREIRTRGSGYDHKMEAAIQLAYREGFDAVIGVTDRDSRPQERRLERMTEGRDRASATLGVAGAVGLAIEKIEAWLLADEKALRKATGDNSIQRQPAPESLASRDKQSENNAKYRLQQLIAKARPADANLSKVYADIALAADLGTVAKRCPKGFAPFADDVRRLSSKKSPAGK